MNTTLGNKPKGLEGPLVFLDIDGVLTRKPKYGTINSELLKEFLYWIDTIQGNVVLISSWREDTLEKTLKLLPEKLAKVIAAQVPNAYNFPGRAYAITRWCNENAAGQEQLVILDDDGEEYAGTPLEKFVVSPDTETGMKAPWDYFKAFAILINQKYKPTCNQ